MVSQAVIPSWIAKNSQRAWIEWVALLGGTVYVTLLAQISIPLSFTPVPITGQTFRVATLALFWGRKRACACFGLYLWEGWMGLPVFAQGRSGFQLGPTLGYLLGMGVACWVVGALADRGKAHAFKSAFLSCLLGSACVFTFGLAGLSFFLPFDQVLTAGFFPFLPGDLIKNCLAAYAVSEIDRRSRPKSTPW